MRGVYTIKNSKNGKQYIGSSLNVRRRFITHRHLLNKGIHHCSHLQRAWNKYGKECFKFELLEEVERSELLEVREQYWIDNVGLLYNSCKVAGNKSGFKHTEVTKCKISLGNSGKKRSNEFKTYLSKLNKGNTHSIETRKKISDGLTGTKQNLTEDEIKRRTERLKPYMTGQTIGFKHSEETKRKISIKKTGIKQSEATKIRRAKSLEKQIVQYDKDMNHIKDWDSIKQASLGLGIRRSFISLVLTGRKKSAKGFIFKYKK